MKKALLLALLAVMAGSLSAQQFAKTGVVNMTRVYAQFFKESKSVREFEELKASIQKEIDAFKDEIRELNDQKNAANSAGDATKARTFEAEIAKKQEALKEFARQKQEQLKAKSEEVKNDTTFSKKVFAQIDQEALSKGFSLILYSDNPAIAWFAPEADITDGVISRLLVDFPNAP